MDKTLTHDAYYAAQAADDRYSNVLREHYGEDACNARYLPYHKQPLEVQTAAYCFVLASTVRTALMVGYDDTPSTCRIPG